MNIEVPQNRFTTIIADNSNWCIGYLAYLSHRVMERHWNGLIKDYPFYTHVTALLDQEDILSFTGNLDADLP